MKRNSVPQGQVCLQFQNNIAEVNTKMTFDKKEKKIIKVTVRFTEEEIEIMEKYMEENNIKSKTDLIRLALGNFVK